jgi:hypothetical protein
VTAKADAARESARANPGRRESSIGSHAIAIRPPRYGIDFADRRVSDPDEPHERDADRLAREFLTTHPSTSLQETPGTFGRFVGRDLSDVRIDHDAASDSAARALATSAFTIDNRIGIARGRASVPVLAHELAHVAAQRERPQLRGTIWRAPPSDDAERARREAATPTEIAPGLLSNQELLDAIAAVSRELAPVGPVDAQRRIRLARAQALIDERKARAQAGQVWLDDPFGGRLLTLRDQGNVVAVHEARDARESRGGLGRSAAVLTERQLHDMLAALHIQTVGAATTGATLGTGLYTAGDRAGYAPRFARPLNTNTLNKAFTGDAGEYFYGVRAPGSAGRVDLNTRAWRRPISGGGLANPQVGAFPAFDFLDGANPVQIKTSLADSDAGRFGYFDTGLADIQNRSSATGTGFSTFDQAVFNLEPPNSLRWPPNSPTLTPAERAAWQAARQRYLQRARLAVNPENLVDYRDDVARRMARGRSTTYQQVIDAYLALQPEIHNGVRYTTLAQINAAPAAERATIMTRLCNRIVATQIVSGGIAGPSIARLAGIRTRLGLDPAGSGSTARADVTARTWPELLAVGEHGYARASGRAAVPGAAVGGGGAVLTEVALTYLQTGQLPTGERVIVSGTGGTLGGAAGAAGETAVQARLAQTAFAQRMASGSTALGRAGAPVVRGIGGGAVAGPVSGVITLGTMAYYDASDPRYDPRGLDYFGAGGRAFVVGGLSGLGSSALTFALFGATLGPVGFLVGLIVGVGLYLLTDYLIGARVERGLRYVGEPLFGPAAYEIR